VIFPEESPGNFPASAGQVFLDMSRYFLGKLET
jgi:hypothetical protein